MPSFRTVRHVPFTPREMFDVVADVERYPEFLPLCEGLVVTERKTGERGTELTATMTVGYKSITERFTTHVTLDPEAGRIKVRHLDGPFSHLENDWRFVPSGTGCEVHFAIDYAFRSAMLSLIVGAAFDKAVRSYTEAFEARARTLYGSRAGA
ncbi:type II toxin-antitoxin system RatA family toxin [Hyphomicrobium sp.]|uniref:type II toxin-antitoxin system RatA family toxin n=1 Tax=Hyphomicrobium sp. TaxID=82 RepID=UPI0025C0F58F|nr:type II toxin-antitoxin system RatA family toxin [Hyphomicrobium sp.]MCC7250888.1 type II toxin-antitoxin system RatA family toxin [Hyphomicrobium sp.]